MVSKDEKAEIANRLIGTGKCGCGAQAIDSYQAVPCCQNCYLLATRLDARATNRLRHVISVYRGMLGLLVARGQLTLFKAEEGLEKVFGQTG